MPIDLKKLSAKLVPEKVFEIKKFLDAIPAKSEAPYYTAEEIAALPQFNCSVSLIFTYRRYPVLSGYSKCMRRKYYFSSRYHIKRL